MFWPCTWQLVCLTNLDNERERERVGLICSADCLLHLVIACAGRWGAIWFRLIFPAGSWIPSNCCLDPFVVAMGLPSGSHIHSAYLFGWVSKCDRACLDRTRQQERGVCIYHGRHLQRETSSSISSSSSSPQEHSTGDI